VKNLLLAAFVCLPFFAFAQTSEIKKPAKLMVGFTASPDYCYRTLRGDNGTGWIADSRDQMEMPKFGYTVGGRVMFSLLNRVSFETGLLFSDKGEKTKVMTYYYLQPEPNAPVSGEHNYHYYHLDVPAKVNYYLTSSRCKFFVSGGTAVNIFLQEKRTSTLNYADGHTEKRDATSSPGFMNTSISGLAGAGVDFDLNERLRFRIEPIYRHALVSFTSSPVKSYLHSAGVNWGVFLSL